MGIDVSMVVSIIDVIVIEIEWESKWKVREAGDIGLGGSRGGGKNGMLMM